MRLVPLVGIVTIAWLLIIGEVYLFFNVILAFAPPIHELGSLTALALLKVGSTLGLGALWFVVMSTLAELYTSSRIRRLTPRPSS
ncbi:MAG: hypothetical protein OK438_07525 [Thaumarchaeota archaeon]|nr:hypothetical protein [Nitrososphaerota archaeon]